jgi:enterochelin esterase-like enzyme
MALPRSTWTGRAACLLLLVLAFPTPAADVNPLSFQITFDKTVSASPFTGRVYVMLSRNATKQLQSSINWFNPEPVFARDVKDWKPGEILALDADALGFPYSLSKLPKGTYSIQAVMDFNRGDIHFSTAEGNGYSSAVRRELTPSGSGVVKLTIDQTYKARAFKETERVKLVDVESKLLTAFYGRPTRMRAGVVLPKSFASTPGRRYPVVYDVPGFGGDHFAAFGAERRNATDVAGVEMLYVVLDPNCQTGHHVFADSANNGPRGQALVEELIPHVEKEFRGLNKPSARFVTGHSSGGWSSLWLQVTYPDTFGGCWSTAPDPVDFRDFQRLDLQKPGANLLVDADGKQRPLARMGGRQVLFFKPFSDMEMVMGHGGQLGSFEAVFSPRGADGQPKQLWDRTTGAIDREVAKSWERYDVRLVLERNWKTLGPRLAGKVHVFMGLEDTFYLEGAAVLLKDALKQLGSDAVVELIPGKHHGSLVDKNLRERMAREMADRFRQGQGK